MRDSISRRQMLGGAVGLSAVGLYGSTTPMFAANESKETIAGFDQTQTDVEASPTWQMVSDRKIRVGLVGYGVCQFGLEFGLQNHPNTELVAVSDLIPERCAAMAKAAQCEKTYPSLEEMLKDDTIEAIFLATDAPSHARQAIDVLNHGKHVASAVPCCYNSIEDGERLLETVKKNRGLNYMMFETSAFHDDCYAMRQIYQAGGFGKLVYCEGEYYHWCPTPIDSYKGWRVGSPPLVYPTHATAYYCCVSGGSFTEVSCMGMPSRLDYLGVGKNPYDNPFGTEVAMMRTVDGGMARMTMSKDTPGFGAEAGRVRGQLGSYDGSYQGTDEGTAIVNGLNLKKPALPPGVSAGSHGGSHGYLGNEFVESILEARKPLVDIRMALNLTVCGIVAHQSALKDGELMKIPQYEF